MLESRLQRQIDAYFDGDLAAADTKAMFSALESSPEAKAYFARRRLLSQMDPKAMGEQARIARGLGLKPRPPRRSWLMVTPALLTAAAVLFLWVRAPDDEFSPRGEG